MEAVKETRAHGDTWDPTVLPPPSPQRFLCCLTVHAGTAVLTSGIRCATGEQRDHRKHQPHRVHIAFPLIKPSYGWDLTWSLKEPHKEGVPT